MPQALLTDVSIRALPMAEKPYDVWDTKLPSFGVRIGKHTKTFVINQDKMRRTIGRFGVISLSEARTEAKRLMAERTLGNTRPNAISYDNATKAYLADKAKRRRPRTIADYTRHLALFRFKCQLEEITTEEIERKLKGLGPGEFNHRLASLRIFFNWAVQRRYVKYNPTASITSNQTKSRKRTLTDAELKAVWIAAEQTEGHFGVIIKLLIATGQRRGETAALQKGWYSHNQQTLCLPAEITKNGREHLFPIGPLTASVLKSTTVTATGHFLFPARGISSKSFNGWSKSKKALDKLCKVSGWTLHDLRRTYRSNLGRLGVAPHLAERMINHVSSRSPLEDTYDIWPYLDEIRAEQTKYEQWLGELLELC